MEAGWCPFFLFIYFWRFMKCSIFWRLESRTKLCSYNLVSVPFFSVGWTKLHDAVFQTISSTICSPVLSFYPWLLNENIFYQSELTSGGARVFLCGLFLVPLLQHFEIKYVFFDCCVNLVAGCLKSRLVHFFKETPLTQTRHWSRQLVEPWSEK